MENKKTFKAENGKQRGKLFAILGLCAGFLCTLTAGAVTLPVNAMDTTTAATVSGDLWDTANGKFSKTSVESLLSKTTGKSSYPEALTYLNSKSGVITSADINTLNEGKDLVLDFGGKKWTVTYLSKNNNGELIATLWYAGAEDTASFSDGWVSTTERGSVEGHTIFSNLYGGSQLRSVALGNGGQYYTAETGKNIMSDSEVTIVSPKAEDVQASAFYEFAQGKYSTYLAAPIELDWQKAQYSRQYSINRNLNENLIYVTENWFNTNVQKGQNASL